MGHFTPTQDIDFSHLEPLSVSPEASALPPSIVASRDENAGSRSYRLLVPLIIEEESKRRRLTTVRMRHPCQAEVDAWGRGEIAGRRDLLCLMTGQPAAVIDALAWPDAAALHQIFSDMVPEFIMNSQI